MARIKGVRVVSFARLKLDLKRGLGFIHETEDFGSEWESVVNLHDFAKSQRLPRCPLSNDIEFQGRPGDAKSYDDGEREYRAARRTWEEDIVRNEEYQKATQAIITAQQTDAIRIRWFWLYSERVHMLEGPSSGAITDDRACLLVKHHVASEDAVYERLKREIAAFDNLGRLKGASREPLSESVRLFVWQRDRGRCVQCESQSELEFDHIIPLSKGGASTERNVQLLCGLCNRTKGAKV